MGVKSLKVADKYLSVLTKESLIAFLEVTKSENEAKLFSILILYDDHAVPTNHLRVNGLSGI